MMKKKKRVGVEREEGGRGDFYKKDEYDNDKSNFKCSRKFLFHFIRKFAAGMQWDICFV